MIDKNGIEKLMNTVGEKVYSNDKYLINIKEEYLTDTQKHNGERAIVFRFAVYFDEEIKSNDQYKSLREYNIDCEYNRNIYDIKRIPSCENEIVPDLIIHKRGNNENNFLVVEFKTWWNNNQENDERKIKDLTNKNGEYKYKFGICATFEKEEFVINKLIEGGANGES